MGRMQGARGKEQGARSILLRQGYGGQEGRGVEIYRNIKNLVINEVLRYTISLTAFL
jgi:hypothetical protein